MILPENGTAGILHMMKCKQISKNQSMYRTGRSFPAMSERIRSWQVHSDRCTSGHALHPGGDGESGEQKSEHPRCRPCGRFAHLSHQPAGAAPSSLPVGRLCLLFGYTIQTARTGSFGSVDAEFVRVWLLIREEMRKPGARVPASLRDRIARGGGCTFLATRVQCRSRACFRVFDCTF